MPRLLVSGLLLAAPIFAEEPIAGALPTGEYLDPVTAEALASGEGEGEEQAAGQTSPFLFRDVTAEAGVSFRYTFGDWAYDNILESSGSGVTWFDADGDGDLDLYFLNGSWLEGISDPKGRAVLGATNHLYCNQGDGTFLDCTRRSGLGDPAWSMAASAADYDGDDDVDLFVSSFGPNRLYRNDGSGRFRDVAGEAGLVGPPTLNGFTKWSVGGSWFDVDSDGDLDLAVCNFLAFDPTYLRPGREWEMPEPSEYDGQPSLLYLQENGRFREVTREEGLYRPDSKCMGLTVADLDGDGRLEIFQGNDHQPNFLFHRDAHGGWHEVAGQAGVAVNDQGIGTGSMHGTPGDVDGDGRLDLVVVDLRHGSLYRQRAPLAFEDRTWASGLGRLLDGLGQWGAGLVDFDLDGDLDFFCTDGVAHLLVEQHPVLAENDGQGHFRDARAGAGEYFRGLRSGRGAAFADYDDDGDLDIAVSHVDHRATATLLRNDSPRAGSWIGFALVARAPGTELGATVTVVAAGRSFLRVLQPSAGYLAGNDPRLLFGLGTADEVEEVTVDWPSGRRETFRGLDTGRYWRLAEGGGTARGRSTHRAPTSDPIAAGPRR